MEQMHTIQKIDNEIENLKMEKKKIKQNQKKSIRLKSNNFSKSNVIGRMSTDFKDIMDDINSKREENGFDSLSYPKITKLIIRHKACWKTIEDDIIRYNTQLDTNEEAIQFNEM